MKRVLLVLLTIAVAASFAYANMSEVDILLQHAIEQQSKPAEAPKPAEKASPAVLTPSLQGASTQAPANLPVGDSLPNAPRSGEPMQQAPRAGGAAPNISIPATPPPTVTQLTPQQKAAKQADATTPPISLVSYGRRLGDLALEIGNMTGYAVSFGPMTDPNQIVVADLRNVPLSHALETITAGVNYGFEIKGKAIVIQRLVPRKFSIPMTAIVQPNVSADMGGDLLGQTGSTSGSGGSSSFGSSVGGTGSTDQNVRASVTLKKPADVMDGKRLFELNIQRMVSADGHYILDWPSATVMVVDSPRNLDLVESYIKEMWDSASKQLLVQGSISIVATTEGSQWGIDWNILANRIGGVVLSGPNSSTRIVSDIARVAEPAITITRTATDISGVLKALQTQGQVSQLSKPYMYVRNLQPVAIFSGKSVPYISSIQRTVSGSIAESTTSFQMARAQDGVIMSVQCQVREDGLIDVQIAPILAAIEDNVTFTVDGNTFTSPISSIQQTLQSVTVRDGDTIIIGGISRSMKKDQHRNIPILSAIPLLGELFKGHDKTDTVGELVIALRVQRVDTKL